MGTREQKPDFTRNDLVWTGDGKRLDITQTDAFLTKQLNRLPEDTLIDVQFNPDTQTTDVYITPPGEASNTPDAGRFYQKPQ